MTDKYDELKKKLEELEDYVYKFKRDYEDRLCNLDENNFTDEFKRKITK